jgi:phospholipid transport system substrate-binding protein
MVQRVAAAPATLSKEESMHSLSGVQAIGRRRAVIIAAAAIVMTTALPLGGRTAAAADDAAAFVQTLGDRVVKVLQQKLPRDQTEQQLNDVWLSAFDVAAIGRTVLGTHWKAATDEQRKAYMEVFPKYVAKLYAIQFSDYSGETFAVSGSAPLAAGQTLVHSQIVRPGKDPIRCDFVISTAGQVMKIMDVKVEGVSLLITKRTEFDSVVAQKGIDGLIAAMRQKVS